MQVSQHPHRGVASGSRPHLVRYRPPCSLIVRNRGYKASGAMVKINCGLRLRTHAQPMLCTPQPQLVASLRMASALPCARLSAPHRLSRVRRGRSLTLSRLIVIATAGSGPAVSFVRRCVMLSLCGLSVCPRMCERACHCQLGRVRRRRLLAKQSRRLKDRQHRKEVKSE
jgi:hypothetical protein